MCSRNTVRTCFASITPSGSCRSAALTVRRLCRPSWPRVPAWLRPAACRRLSRFPHCIRARALPASSRRRSPSSHSSRRRPRPVRARRDRDLRERKDLGRGSRSAVRRRPLGRLRVFPARSRSGLRRSIWRAERRGLRGKHQARLSAHKEHRPSQSERVQRGASERLRVDLDRDSLHDDYSPLHRSARLTG